MMYEYTHQTKVPPQRFGRYEASVKAVKWKVCNPANSPHDNHEITAIITWQGPKPFGKNIKFIKAGSEIEA